MPFTFHYNKFSKGRNQILAERAAAGESQAEKGSHVGLLIALQTKKDLLHKKNLGSILGAVLFKVSTYGNIPSASNPAHRK